MASNWTKETWAEPYLQFKRELDAVHPEPRYGLKNYGPLDFNTGRRPTEFGIQAGLICKEKDRKRVLAFLNGLEKSWDPKMKGSKVKYSGFEDIYKAPLNLPTDEEVIIINDEEIGWTLENDDPFNAIVHLFRQKIEDHQSIAPEKNVLVVHIPEDFAKYFKYANRDLRNEVKAICVSRKQKTQIITERTLQSTYPCDNYWNLSIGFYVKAGGMPWKVAGRENYNCYIGISFGIDQTGEKQVILIGLAEVFDEFGEHVTIEAVDCSAEENEFILLADGYHINKQKSQELMTMAINRYKEWRNRSPELTTVHKTSSFKTGEKEGFLEGISGSSNLVHLKYKTDLKLIPDGGYPPRRGVFWKIDDQTSLLYTTGVVAINKPNEYIFDETYPGIGTARPVELSIDHSISDAKTIALDVLKLTKMNLNTTRLMSRRPITTSLSRKVVNVLKTGIRPEEIYKDFRYYI